MSKIESAVAGYLSGFFAGSLMIVLVIGWIGIQVSDDIEIPEFVNSLIDTIKQDYMNPNQSVFVATFIFGLLTALAGSKEAVDKN